MTDTCVRALFGVAVTCQPVLETVSKLGVERPEDLTLDQLEEAFPEGAQEPSGERSSLAFV